MQHVLARDRNLVDSDVLLGEGGEGMYPSRIVLCGSSNVQLFLTIECKDKYVAPMALLLVVNVLSEVPGSSQQCGCPIRVMSCKPPGVCVSFATSDGTSEGRRGILDTARNVARFFAAAHKYI